VKSSGTWSEYWSHASPAGATGDYRVTCGRRWRATRHSAARGPAGSLWTVTAAILVACVFHVPHSSPGAAWTLERWSANSESAGSSLPATWENVGRSAREALAGVARSSPLGAAVPSHSQSLPPCREHRGSPRDPSRARPQCRDVGVVCGRRRRAARAGRLWPERPRGRDTLVWRKCSIPALKIPAINSRGPAAVREVEPGS